MARNPLADSIRPKTLQTVIGQEKLVGENGLITKLLQSLKENDFFPSMIFWGPPGCGKTTIARIIAREAGHDFYEFSAVETSIKEIKTVIMNHKGSLFLAPIIFIDEIHRFNKTQQDALLPHVENGNIIFLGATTENPSFSVISPLLSRCRVIVLEPLSDIGLKTIIDSGIIQLNQSYKKNIQLEDDAHNFLIQASNADARTALNVLEIAYQLFLVNPNKTLLLNTEILQEALQRESLGFDKNGDEFYNTISALHKTMRGSDPDAALYYLARMLEAGQDPLYISRRLIRFASEDIGLADSRALQVAVNADYACKNIGMPECKVNLAHAVAFLAKAPKSNQVYAAYNQAASDVQTHGNLPIPKHILNAPTKLMKSLDYGKGYEYSHDPEGLKNENIEYMPDKLREKKYL